MKTLTSFRRVCKSFNEIANNFERYLLSHPRALSDKDLRHRILELDSLFFRNIQSLENEYKEIEKSLISKNESKKFGCFFYSYDFEGINFLFKRIGALGEIKPIYIRPHNERCKTLIIYHMQAILFILGMILWIRSMVKPNEAYAMGGLALIITSILIGPLINHGLKKYFINIDKTESAIAMCIEKIKNLLQRDISLPESHARAYAQQRYTFFKAYDMGSERSATPYDDLAVNFSPKEMKIFEVFYASFKKSTWLTKDIEGMFNYYLNPKKVILEAETKNTYETNEIENKKSADYIAIPMP